MAIFVVFDGPPEKAVESLVDEVVSEDEAGIVDVVIVVWVDVREDEFEIDGVVQGVGVGVDVDDGDGDG